KKLFKACKNIWNNIVNKKMYIIGGIGSTVHGEAFTYDYDLPNDTMYCETCASIGLTFFSLNMLKNESDVSYGNIIEKCLYNTIISGTALDGEHFFYVNPLEVLPIASDKDPDKKHVKATRPSWFGTACCPPNIARTLSSLDKYLYTRKKDTLLVNMFMDNSAAIKLNGGSVEIKQTTEFPYNGKSTFDVALKDIDEFNLGIRIPAYSENFRIINKNNEVKFRIKANYAYINITESMKLEVKFDMPIIQWMAHPRVRTNQHKVALQRGPFVYCLEEEDNGQDLSLIHLTNEKISEKRIVDPQLGDIVMLTTD